MEKINIVFFGAGAVAAELTSYIEADTDKSKYNIKGYVCSDDNGYPQWERYKYKKPYLGYIQEYEIAPDDRFIIALNNYKVKREIVDLIRSKGGKFISFIHQTSLISNTAILGEGNVIGPYTIIGPNVVIGDFNSITSQAIISHDSVIGNYNFLATSLLCGYNIMGDDNFFGIRSTTNPNIAVGNRNVIKSGMLVDCNIEDDSTVFYKYKERIIAIPK